MSFGLTEVQQIAELGLLIIQQIKQTRANEHVCKRLGERVNIVMSSLHALFLQHGVDISRLTPPSGHPLAARPKAGRSPVQGRLPQRLNTPEYISALRDFANLLTDIKTFVDQFAHKHRFKKFAMARSHAKKCINFGEGLNDCAIQLNLGIQAYQLRNAAEDKADLEKDFEHIIVLEKAILSKTQEMINQQKMGALQQDQFNRIQMEKIASLQATINNLNTSLPTRNVNRIDEELLVPYYQLEFDEAIQKGSLGEVYKGRWQEQIVAIKRVENLDDNSEKEFIREVQIMSKLRSPHVVQFYAACIETNRAALIMEYMAKGSLFDYLKLNELTASEKNNIIENIVRGLIYLHQNQILHRDLKSANILLDAHLQAKISDFGLSKTQAKNVMTVESRSQAVAWLAPEFLNDHSRYTKASDVYSLGIIIWEILTGQVPYAGLSNAKILQQIEVGIHLETNHPAIPPEYATLLNRCWHKDPRTRPSLENILATILNHPIPTLDHRAIGARLDAEGRHYEALVNYQKAIEAGNTQAYTNIGTQLIGGIQDPRMAHHFFKLSANGHPPHTRGMCNLANTYQTGFGTKNNVIKLDKARFWFQRAADLGDANGEQGLSSLRSTEIDFGDLIHAKK